MDVNKEKKDEAKTDVSETWNWAATSRNLGTSLAGRYTCPGAGAVQVQVQVQCRCRCSAGAPKIKCDPKSKLTQNQN